MPIQIQIRRGQSGAWTSVNPILADGEIALESDTSFYKVGDGVKNWNDLDYGGLRGIQGTAGIRPEAFAANVNDTYPGGGPNNPSGYLNYYYPSASSGYAVVDLLTSNLWIKGSTGTWNNLGAVVGVQGFQGVQGRVGPQGIAGFFGSQGVQGVQGPQGGQGVQGVQGRLGLQGSQGPQGRSVQGAKGEDGARGLQGIQGIQGPSQGPPGAQGVDGAQGVQGVQGADGLSVQGAQGAQGLQGLQGRTGSQGVSGIIGLGLQGLQGLQGVQGLQGRSGAQGTMGESGAQGVQGVQGRTGAQGITGETGLQGAQGMQGVQGVQGRTGAQGTFGEVGLQGVQGVQGDTGIQGRTGAQGVTGEVGIQGVQGIQGLMGNQGIAADSTQVIYAVDTANSALSTANARQRMQLDTAKSSTSGTSIDFTGIPSWVKKITLMLSGVSTNSTSAKMIQLGTSSGIQTSGYDGGSQIIQQNVGFSGVYQTNGIPINSVAASDTVSGAIVFTLLSASSNTWTAQGVFRNSSIQTGFSAGSVALPSILTQLRITTVNGTDLFDAGTINILYEGYA